MSKLFLAGGILFGAYYLGLIAFSGIRATFSLFWLLLSLFCFAALLYLKLCRHFPGRFEMPLPVKVFLTTSLVLGLALFLFVEAQIVGGMRRVEPETEPRFIVVLGAQVRGRNVSRALKQRLDTALDYWEEHKNSVIIVSGGKGPGEEISEAEAMYTYLRNAGVPQGRLVRESKSRNTVENLRNCLTIIQYTEEPVMVVSSDFHVYRATQIAETMTEREVLGLPARTDWILLPNYMVREFFAVLKDWFFGKI